MGLSQNGCGHWHSGDLGSVSLFFLRPWKDGGRSFEHWRCTCCVNGRPAAPPAGAVCPARGALCPALRARRGMSSARRGVSSATRKARCVQREARRGAARCVQRRRGRGPVAAGRGAPGICSEWCSPIRFQSQLNDRVIEHVILCSWVAEVEKHSLPIRMSVPRGRAGIEIRPGR